MTGSIHKAAFQAEQPPPAEAITTDPTARLEAMYRRIWANSMRDLPFVNPALSVEAVGFRRWQSVGALRLATASSPVDQSELIDRPLLSASGDWLGTVITPWFVNLFLVPGGGNLWSDRRPGERCHVQFPIGPLEFIAYHDASAEIPSYQHCALFAPPGHLTLVHIWMCIRDRRRTARTPRSRRPAATFTEAVWPVSRTLRPMATPT